MIREIYKGIVEDSKYSRVERKETEKLVEGLLMEKYYNIPAYDYEELRDIMFQIVETAEENGFVIGFQYAVSLILESKISKLQDFNNL